MPIPRITNNYTALYAQDDWRVSSKLTLNLGLRWEYDSDLTGQSSAHAPCPNLTGTPTTPCTWMANVIPLHKDPDTKDFGPRVGFVYDPFGHGNTAIRGGYGIYYDRITLEAGSKELVQNDRALTVTQYAGSSCTNPGIPAPTSLGLCFAPGSQFADRQSHDCVGLQRTAPDWRCRYCGAWAQLASSTVSAILSWRAATGWQYWVVAADGLHVFGARMLIGSLLRNTSSSSPNIQCAGNNRPCLITDPVSGITDSVTILDSSAKSWYDGLLMSVGHREGRVKQVGYEFNISYTLSKTFDYSNDDQLENNNKDEQVNLVEGSAGLRKEKGYALSDERQRITLYGLSEASPWF